MSLLTLDTMHDARTFRRRAVREDLPSADIDAWGALLQQVDHQLAGAQAALDAMTVLGSARLATTSDEWRDLRELWIDDVEMFKAQSQRDRAARRERMEAMA